ncbi:MAG: hypothetical protein ACREN8_13525 [Candidatus Dormibacteraceae bacterium]
MPPADVFVAALKATGISLDERLGIGREPTEVEQQMASLKEELQKQRQRIAALEALQQNQE